MGAIDRIASSILAIVGQVPITRERKRKTPEVGEKARANDAAAKAALAAGALALPSGPVG